MLTSVQVEKDYTLAHSIWLAVPTSCVQESDGLHLLDPGLAGRGARCIYAAMSFARPCLRFRRRSLRVCPISWSQDTFW
jgi:hypothetical protein